MKNIVTVIGLVSIILFACNKQDESAMLAQFTINGENISLGSSDFSIKNGMVYLSVPSLEKHLQLEFKDILPGRQIGICRADICIPFEIGNYDNSKAFQDDDTYYIPVPYLMQALGDDAKWDPEMRTLEITVYDTGNNVRLEAFMKKNEPSAVDITLPDLNGRDVSLSNFSGKKVAVFVWASW